MPNLYTTPAEIKDGGPDFISGDTTKYDDALLRGANIVSRWIDRHCQLAFYPRRQTRYLRGSGKEVLRIPHVISIDTLEYSDDDGQTYTALAESGNWYLARSGGPDAWEFDFEHPGSYDLLVLDPNAAIGTWPRDFRGMKITGLWAYADDRDEAQRDTGITLSSDPGSGSTIALDTDPAGADLWGLSPAVAAGMLLQLETEILECTAIQSAPAEATVLRGRNGSSTVAHASGTAVEVWRAPEPVRQAAAIQIVRTIERAQQGFADTRANTDVGELMWLKRIDPEVQELLMTYRMKGVPA